MDFKAKLQEAKALISDVSHWTQGFNAKDATGHGVVPTHSDACQWCARGALLRVFGIGDWYESPLESRRAYESVQRALDECALSKYPNKSMVGVNDDIGHAAVMEMFDCGIHKFGG